MNKKDLKVTQLVTLLNARFSSLSRTEKSLTGLTKKFMTLLQESHNGILDLRSVNIFFLFNSLVPGFSNLRQTSKSIITAVINVIFGF